ncbi:restriction endonuclease subunit S [Enterococcus faecalis]|uniref:restriction endonuclease subunit S n=4 Tax=Enterococcus faecalis TaxID=1351 RepID=UPI00046C4F26|nr:restriction endonuclease subunit S [Enterococcus faecalis]EGO2632574.1 restriction endonuclease subunit S [Enterococcus faecalis]EGO7618221.1 restriction endonuclease subunit S [Enterococcus faecalis]EGO7913073.1 restriction endonuclease subunit S [Enterococcus faecalis]EHG5970949.1 restriction endonuclease subunit S [Enterococcus faecalis]EHU8863178.1 restriction endonuclease subunit S [Enterococcus faecalis]
MRDEMKKVPRLRFRGFSEDWELCKLGRIFDVHTDFVSNGSFQSLKNNVRFYNDENYAYMIRLQDASNNWRGPWLYTDKHGFDFLKKSTVYENDILMSDRGTIGKFFLVPKLDRPMTLSSNAVLLRSSNCNNNFIYYMLNTIDIGNQIKKRTTPGVQPMISKTEFKKIITKLPVREEQKKIGDFLKKIDETFTLHQRKSDQLKELKKAYLQLMFPTKEERVPKLRFADFEGEWELCKLNGILDIIKGTQKSKSELSTNQNNCTPYPVYNGGINPSGYTNIYNRENAITISEGGNSAGFVNFVQEKFFSGGHNYTIVNNVTDTLFLFFYLCSIQEEIMRLRVGTGLPNIQKPTLMNLEIQKTTDNEQKSIGLFLKNIDILISLTQNKLNQLKSLKKSYLQNMFI